VLLDHVRSGKLAMISSPELLDELADVLARPKFAAILVRSNISSAEKYSRVSRFGRGAFPATIV
jgi:hypothetical protein